MLNQNMVWPELSCATFRLAYTGMPAVLKNGGRLALTGCLPCSEWGTSVVLSLVAENWGPTRIPMKTPTWNHDGEQTER